MPRSQLFASLESHYLGAGTDQHNTQLMLDVAELHSALVSTPRATRESVKKVSAWYLALNASALLAAIATYDDLPATEVSRLMSEHKELNHPDGILAWASRMHIEHARMWLAISVSGKDESIPIYGEENLDDDLNLLRRILEYSKYSTATDSAALVLSPVSDYLDYSER